MIGARISRRRKEKAKNGMWVCLNRLGARVRGFRGVSEPSDLDRAVPDARGVRLTSGLRRGVSGV